MMSLVVWFEEEFGVPPEAEELNLDNFGTIDLMADYLKRTAASRADAPTAYPTQRDDAWSVVNRCESQRKTARSTIGSGGVEAAPTRRTTSSCYMPTVIGRSTCKNDGQKRPRPARGVREGLSCMTGNCHVQF